VERAALSKGALQHHFRTKEDLIAAVVETLLGRTLARTFPLRDEPGRSDEEIVASELRAVWTNFIDTGAYRALLEILVAARTDEQLRARIEPMLHGYNQQLDQYERLCYEPVSGDPADVEVLLVMNRALMRGLVIQDRYVADPSYTLRIIDRWISLAAPLLRPRRKLRGIENPAADDASAT
jgi:AcrR family transcriptional regulator